MKDQTQTIIAEAGQEKYHKEALEAREQIVEMFKFLKEDLLKFAFALEEKDFELLKAVSVYLNVNIPTLERYVDTLMDAHFESFGIHVETKAD